MRASARELLVPFFTLFDSNPRPLALKADALLTKLSGWSKMFCGEMIGDGGRDQLA